MPRRAQPLAPYYALRDLVVKAENEQQQAKDTYEQKLAALVMARQALQVYESAMAKLQKPAIKKVANKEVA
jgi:hypothetical protein